MTLAPYRSAGSQSSTVRLEHITSETWDAVLRERLLKPLGTKRTATLPEEAILHRAAVGHRRLESGEPVPVNIWSLPRTYGPAGLVVSTPTEVLSFARMHLNDGVAGDGGRVLSAGSVAAMRERHVRLPDTALGEAWGLGWTHFKTNGTTMIGHDGGTIGQLSFLRVAPAQRFAFCLLTNAFSGAGIYNDLASGPFSDWLAIEATAPATIVDEVELAQYTGTYERMSARTRVDVLDGTLVAQVQYGPSDGERMALTVLGGGRFAAPEHGLSLAFFDFDETGRPRYLHSGGRASARMA